MLANGQTVSSADGTSRRSPRGGADLTIKLLHGTLASLRCKQLIDEGHLQEARAQLSVLRCVIDEVAIDSQDEESRTELELLRTQEHKLRALLFGSGPMRRP